MLHIFTDAWFPKTQAFPSNRLIVAMECKSSGDIYGKLHPEDTIAHSQKRFLKPRLN
jgi:hypothetical protein